MIEKLWWLGTLSELKEIEIKIRLNAGIPNDLGTVNWGMSLDNEAPLVLPIETSVLGIYAIPVPANGINGMAWNGCNEACLKEGIICDETAESDFEFKE